MAQNGRMVEERHTDRPLARAPDSLQHRDEYPPRIDVNALGLDVVRTSLLVGIFERRGQRRPDVGT